RLRRPPRPTLSPYTTLFRSSRSCRDQPGLGMVCRPEALLAVAVSRVRPDLPDADPARGDRDRWDLDVQHGGRSRQGLSPLCSMLDRKSTRLNSSHLVISYAV